jgi:hypothetical protein
MAWEKEEVRDSCQNSIECWLAGTDSSARRNHACGVALDCCCVDQGVCRASNAAEKGEAAARRLNWILHLCRGRVVSGER